MHDCTALCVCFCGSAWLHTLSILLNDLSNGLIGHADMRLNIESYDVTNDYVFLQSSGERKPSSEVPQHMDLSSTGSCLPRISSGLYVKCERGLNHCHTDTSVIGLWKPAEGEDRDPPRASNRKKSVYPVSQCRVCASSIH